MANETGLVHVYYGDGKGKTTAAFGLAFRCAGYGHSIVIAQFLKSRSSGELAAAERFPEITVLRGHSLKKFTFQMNEEEKAQLRRDCEDLFSRAAALAIEKNARLLVLDECLDACVGGGLPLERLTAFLAGRPDGMEVVITGHSLPEEIIASADYISKVVKEKHPYDEGITARKTIEY